MMKFRYGVVLMLFAGLLIAFSPAATVWAQTQETGSVSVESAAQTEAATEKPADAQPKLVGSDLGLGGKLGKAVAAAPEGSGKGQIDPNAAPGYLGIPGGKQVSLIVAVLWSIWVGWVFSTVGAFGGVLLWGILDTGLNIMQVSPFWIEVSRGLLLLFAVFLDAIKVQYLHRVAVRRALMGNPIGLQDSAAV